MLKMIWKILVSRAYLLHRIQELDQRVEALEVSFAVRSCLRTKEHPRGVRTSLTETEH